MPLLAALIALYAQAQAPLPEARPRVLVVSLAEGDDVDGLYGALEALGEVPVEAEDRMGVDRPAPPDAFRATAPDDVRAELLAARSAFGAFELEAAELALARAEAGLLRLSAPEVQKDLFAEVLLFRAELALARRDDEEAQAVLRRLARLDDARTELHPGLYPPPLVEAFAKARAANQADPAAAVVVVLPRPPGPAEVYLDGERVEAATPLRTLAGPHLVSVRAPERLTFSAWLDLPPRDTLVLEPLLAVPGAASERAAALQTLRQAPGDPAALARLAELTGASWVVTRGEQTTVWTEQTGNLLVPLGISPGALEWAGAIRAAVQTEEARLAAPPVKDPGVTPGPSVATGPEAEEEGIGWLGPAMVVGAGGVAAALVVGGLTAVGLSYLGYVSYPPTAPDEPPRAILVRGGGT